MKSEALNTHWRKCNENESRQNTMGGEESYLDMNSTENKSPFIQKSDDIVT